MLQIKLTCLLTSVYNSDIFRIHIKKENQVMPHVKFAKIYHSELIFSNRKEIISK